MISNFSSSVRFEPQLPRVARRQERRVVTRKVKGVGGALRNQDNTDQRSFGLRRVALAV